MSRSVCAGLLLMLCATVPGFSQAENGSLESYFTGREVLAKIDLPGTQKGVDLKFNKPVPMDWNEYSSRVKTYGVAIHKGETARITKFVVKNDMIEFQLDGGGFGTAGDDSNTTVSAVVIPKSQFEKDLEKQIAATTDAYRKRDLQRDLDRERSRRDRENAANQNDALIASQMKAQQVGEKRLHGGSRFNLRWQGTIPSDSRNPDTVKQLLAEYIDFDATHAVASAPPPVAASGASVAPGQLKRGMRMDEVVFLMGQGKVVSQSVSNDGLKTQVVEYVTADSVVDVTYVEGVLVRYSMSSR